MLPWWIEKGQMKLERLVIVIFDSNHDRLYNLPSRIISPHSWLVSHSITRSASHDRFVEWEIIEYVLIQMQQPGQPDKQLTKPENIMSKKALY